MLALHDAVPIGAVALSRLAVQSQAAHLQSPPLVMVTAHGRGAGLS